MLRAADVDDQRVGGRTSLELEDARDGGGVLGVGAQTLEGLGREGHQTASAQHTCRSLDVTRSTNDRDGQSQCHPRLR